MFDQNEQTAVASYLKNNPRAMGVLFTLAVLLVQAGNAAAAGAGPVAGP